MKNETFTAERIKDEADAFFEWDGEDRSLVTTTSCLLFAQHIAGLMQARAAQPAPVVPEGVTIERDMMGAMHIKLGEFDFIQIQYQYPYTDNASTRQLAERIAAMLAATPAQGQQVEWRTTAVMLEQANAGLAQLNGKLRAELSALKAQQVGQEPVGYAAQDDIDWNGDIPVRRERFADYQVPLYTAPQPAPAQDVAGLVAFLQTIQMTRLPDGSQHYQEAQSWIDTLAAHDKQSGENK